MKIVLLEDEMIVVRDLTSRLKTMGYNRVDAFDNGAEFLAHLQIHGADLCLVDININGEINGIETIQKLANNSDIAPIPIIYLTAQADKESFDQAKETKPSAYLLKPYNAFELQSAIELAIEHFESKSFEKELDKGIQIIDDKVFIKHKNRYDRISVKDILYLEAFGNYTEIHTRQNMYVVVSQLGKIEQTFNESYLFRCHRSFMVNLQALDGFDDAYVFFGEKAIPISKAQRAEMLSRLRIL